MQQYATLHLGRAFMRNDSSQPKQCLHPGKSDLLAVHMLSLPRLQPSIPSAPQRWDRATANPLHARIGNSPAPTLTSRIYALPAQHQSAARTPELFLLSSRRGCIHSTAVGCRPSSPHPSTAPSRFPAHPISISCDAGPSVLEFCSTLMGGGGGGRGRAGGRGGGGGGGARGPGAGAAPAMY